MTIWLINLISGICFEYTEVTPKELSTSKTKKKINSNAGHHNLLEFFEDVILSEAIDDENDIPFEYGSDDDEEEKNETSNGKIQKLSNWS